eukprot:gene9005-18640_t
MLSNAPRKPSTSQQEKNILEDFFDSGFVQIKADFKKRKLVNEKLASLQLHESRSAPAIQPSKVTTALNSNGSHRVQRYSAMTDWDQDEHFPDQFVSHYIRNDKSSEELLENDVSEKKGSVVKFSDLPPPVHNSNGPSIEELMNRVVVAHTAIAEIVGELVHKKAIAARLDDANKSILGCFQEMLKDVHLKYKDKTKLLGDRVEKMKLQCESLESQLKRKNQQLELAQLTVETLTEDNKRLEALDRSRSLQADLMSNQIQSLEAVREQYVSYLNEVRKMDEEASKNRETLKDKLLMEDKQLQYRQMREEFRDELRQMTLMFKVEENKTRRADYSHKAQMAAASRRVDKSSQTELDSEGVGLWDIADGWTLPVNGTLQARSRWRTAIRFVQCRSCRGQGRFIGQAAALFKSCFNGEPLEWDDDSDDEDADARPKDAVSKTKGKSGVSTGTSTGMKGKAKRVKTDVVTEAWHLPDELLKFVSHVPKTVLAAQPLSTARLLGTIWGIFGLKSRVDREDDVLGYPTQSMIQAVGFEAKPNVLCSSCLTGTTTTTTTTTPLLPLHNSILASSPTSFILLAYISHCERRAHHPLIHMFARIIGAMKDLRSRTARSKTLSTCSPLPTSVLTVYLAARERLMRPYRGRFKSFIDKAKATNPDLMAAEAALQLHE